MSYLVLQPVMRHTSYEFTVGTPFRFLYRNKYVNTRSGSKRVESVRYRLSALVEAGGFCLHTDERRSATGNSVGYPLVHTSSSIILFTHWLPVMRHVFTSTVEAYRGVP